MLEVPPPKKNIIAGGGHVSWPWQSGIVTTAHGVPRDI